MNKKVLKNFIKIICFVFAFSLLLPCLSDIVVNASNDEEAESQSALPPSLDLTEAQGYAKYFPDLKHQAATSCAAWATAYYQFTFEIAKKLNINVQSDNNNLAFSPDYMFNYLNFKNKDKANVNYIEGLTHEDCYDFLKKQGCIKYSDFYGKDSDPYSWYGTGDESDALNNIRNALKYRVSDYHWETIPTHGSNTFITGRNDADLNRMKELLNDGKLLGISTPTKNHKLQDGSSTLIDSYYKLDSNGNEIPSTHALTIVGYNDNYYYDINQNGVADSGEYGAFIVVDSFVNDSSAVNNQFYSGRKYMVMYDSLNTVSLYKNAVSNTKRVGSIIDNKYWYINVQHYENQALTVEVTVSQNERNEFSISLIRDGGTTETKKIEPTFVNEIGGDRGFDGETTDLQSYTFVFDYEAHELYASEGYYYGVEIEDLNNGDNKDTIVQKIVWRDASGYEIEQSDIQESGDTIDDHKSYYMALGTVSLGKSTQRIQKGDTDNLSVNYAPSGLYCTWESSNQSCVTVNNGVVTAVGVGTASVTVTVSSESGKEWSDTCVYTVVEGYGNSLENATTVVLNDIKNGELARSGDESWFKFTPTASDRYFLYINGNTNIKINLYKDNGETLYATEDFEEPSEIVAISKNLTAGQTYHIKLYGLNDEIGAYSFRIAKGSVLTLNLNNDNPDARHVQISTKASCNYNKLQLKIGQQTFTLTKGDDDVLRTEINDVRFKVTFVNNDSLYTTWNIDMDISAVDSLVGSNKTVSAIFSNSILGIGSATSYSNVQVTLMAYKTSFAANVNINSSNSLQLLLNRLQETGYTLSVYSQAGASVNVTSTTKAATGMKIVKKISGTNTIVEVFHVIVLGDVQGDGYIDNMDSVIILKYDAGTGTITNIQKIAGDANQDGIVDNLDSVIILQYDAGMTDIDQCLETTEVPEDIYFGDPVEF